MDCSKHLAAALAYFPFIVLAPAAAAMVCNRIPAAKRHPGLVYPSCGTLALLTAFLFSTLPGSRFKGIDLVAAAVLSVLCFAFAYIRATDVLTKDRWAFIWREIFLVSFAAVNFYLAWSERKGWGYNWMALLCAVSAVLLWRSSPWAKYPLYAATFFLAGGALIFGIYNSIHHPALAQSFARVPDHQLVDTGNTVGAAGELLFVCAPH
jgi:hypothetical protein